MTFDDLKQIALSFPEVTEEPHFEKISFRVRKKIFVTTSHTQSTVTLKLNEIDQSVFQDLNPEAVYPVPNKWGKQGWTIIHYMKVEPSLLADAMKCAYRTVAPKKLGEQLED